MMRLKHKVAVVTGGGSGIGEGLCIEFAREGAAVTVVDIDARGAERVAARITADRGKAFAVQTDITRSDQVRRMRNAVVERFGRIDVLVNNAGSRLKKPFFEQSEDEWRHMIDLNLTAHFLCCQAIGPDMLRNGKGKIINMASVAGHIGRPQRSAYCAAKGGLLSLTRALAADFAGTNICVNSISPGLIESALHTTQGEDADSDQGRLWGKETLAGRWGKPEDIATAAVFFASDESDFITGVDLRVDGGWLSAKARAGEFETKPSAGG